MIIIMIFLHMLAEAAMWFSAGFILIRLLGWWRYNYTAMGKLEQLTDRCKGIQGTFPITTGSVVFIISLLWLIASHGR